MLIRVFLANGQICNFPGIHQVVMHQPGERVPVEPGLLALSAINVLGWVAEGTPELPAQLQEGANVNGHQD